MNWKSTATIGVVGGTVATLLATASPSVDRPRDGVAPPASLDVQQGVALFAETARLRERLRPRVPPTTSTRNPFAYAATAALPPARTAAVEPPTAPSSGASRTSPAFTLVGLAEDRSSGATIMTAILSSPGALQFVKQGERVDGGYRVATITSDSVELLGDDERPLVLRLK
jgi:hypothetical protein